MTLYDLLEMLRMSEDYDELTKVLINLDACLEHLHNLYELKDEKLAVLEIRNHIAWYLKGLPNSNEIKNKIFLQKNISVIIEILNEYIKYIEDLES